MMLVQIYQTLVDNSVENSRVGEKRHVCDVNTFRIKCQKVDEGIMVSDANVRVEHKHSSMTLILDCERKEEYADYMQASLLSFVELLDPFALSSQVRPDVAVTVLSMLCIAFSRYPKTNISLRIFRKVHA
ncbi:hypothetical protein LWI29_033160 [Acer saccharum]|uniref:Uncharacterized protein n=1 Tax=Acer saccharum TaxID=4024 RepID=A0AA39T7T9_ACESA|nr:hypothetical protein LWI29_033160 [Acer saccharum]